MGRELFYLLYLFTYYDNNSIVFLFGEMAIMESKNELKTILVRMCALLCDGTVLCLTNNSRHDESWKQGGGGVQHVVPAQ